MRLYHGTSSTYLESILNYGIKPRGSGANGNWEHTVPSAGDRVYLTDAYAGYFALCATENKERWLIAEVDLDKLDRSLLRPDEDAIAQIAHLDPGFNDVWGDKPVKDYTLMELTEFVRDNIDLWADKWEQVLGCMGNCSYAGVVPVEAITRIGLFDPHSNGKIALMACDPIVSIANYRFCADKYRALTRWLMGEKVEAEAFGPIFDDDHKRQLEDMLRDQQVEIIDMEVDRIHG